MRKRVNLRCLLVLCVGLVLAFNSLVQAQSGGGYDFSWCTIDGGGISWSEGSSYTLGGTIGQPDAGQPMSSGIYTLQGGFWHPACSPQVVVITPSCTGDTLTLTWTANSANMAYDIHHSDTPYFTIEFATKVATVTGTSWQQVGACGDAGANHYYVVRSTCFGAHADAVECAEFDFALVPGS